jgi:phytoene synthase
MQRLSPADTHATPAHCAACRRSIRQGSHSFYLASTLLPVAVREPAYAIYAFCRMADDLIDRDGGGREAIATLHALLDRVYAQRPSEHFIERSLADVVRRFAIPRAIPNALIEGLEWDAAGRRYQSLAELEAYAARVAGTVGIMMTLVMGRRDATTLARAADLGVAMQLTNIVRDIGEDARAGRLFLPLDLMKAAGVDPHRWLLQPEPEDGVRRIAKALLARADTLYERSRDGISQLPRDCQTGIEAARLLYRAIGQKVATGLDPVSQRAVTSRLEKLGCLGQASMVRFHRAGRHVEAPPLEATAFLIDAVRLHHVLPTERPLPPWWQVGARATRMLELLDAFAARETVRPAARQRGAGA